MLGRTIDNYRILELLGEGYLGEVYLAQDLRLDRRVAIRVLPEEFHGDPGAVAGLTQEAQVAARLQHPNIVTIYSVGDFDGRPYIAMEFVDGQTLTERANGQALDVVTAVDLACQICRGLTEAHGQGITHGDVSPDAVLVGGSGRARVLDFGLAVGLGDSGWARAQSRPRHLRTMSPERARGEAPTPASDVFSVGAILYELLTGRALFPGPTVEELERQITSGHRPEFSNLDAGLAAIVRRALDPVPQARYRNARELTEALEEYLQTLAPRPARRRSVVPMVTVAIILAAVIAIGFGLQRDRSAVTPAEDGRKLVLVLPFENLGPPEDEFFAEGITDEIRSRLSLMRGLGVVSRTSARKVQQSDKPLREIIDELDVDYVVEGSIRWDRSSGEGRVRVTPQLTRADDGTSLWADNYDRELRQIFDLQSDIATRVADALDLRLLERERSALTTHPTDDVGAYQAYLRGLETLQDPDFSAESFARTVEMFERAVSLDPGFAVAHARLGTSHAHMVHYGFDRSEKRLRLAQASIDRAFALEPNLPEAHLAQGYYYYWGRRDYDRALLAFEAARRLGPGSAEVLSSIGYVKRRQGEMAESVALLQRSLELNPLDAITAVSVGETFGTMRRYPDAEGYLQRSLTIAPQNAYPYTELALLYLRWRGDTDAARATLASVPATDAAERYRVAFLVELLDRDYPAALRVLTEAPGPAFEASIFYLPVSLLRGITLRLMPGEEYRSELAAARDLLEARLTQDESDFRTHSALGLTFAALGEEAKALEHGARSVQLYPLSRDALEGPAIHFALAETYASLGHADRALPILDHLLSIPSIVSVAWVDADPRWDSLREHPEFGQLLSRHRAAAAP